MSKLLLLLIIAVVAYLWWKKLQGDSRHTAPGGRGALPESMLKCARCGVHFPASEAVVRNGSAYCSPSHAEGGTP